MNPSVSELVEELFDFALNNLNNQLKRVDLGIVSPEIAEKIAHYTQRNLQSYVFTLDNYGILHTLSKHGITQLEALRGQIGIGKDDFLQLDRLISEVDAISEDGTSGVGNPALVFEKVLDKRYFSVWEIRTVKKKRKINRLFFITMYAPKNKKSLFAQRGFSKINRPEMHLF